MGLSSARLYNGRLGQFAVLACLALSLTLLIVAVSLHNLYSFNADQLSTADLTVSGSAHFGAFYGCADIDGVERGQPFSVHQCHTIRADCQVTFVVSTPAGSEEFDMDGGPNWSCAQYNAFRALLVVAIVLVAFALLAAALSLLRSPQSRLLMAATVGLCSLAVVCTVVSWGLVADHWKNVNDGGEWFKRGPAFGLVVTAFVLMVLAEALYGAVWRIESAGYTKHGSGSGHSDSAAMRGKATELRESPAAADDTVVETA